MEPWSPDEPEFDPSEQEERSPNVPVAFVATQDPIPLRVAEIPDWRTPEGMVCMGTYLLDHKQPIARSAVPPDMLSDIEASGAFGDPVRLALAAVEEAPGIQCRLFALLPAEYFQEPEPEEPEEPWAASVPRFEDQQARQELPENAVVPFLLGHIVRFKRDRKHPDDLAMEAGDVLQTVLTKDSTTTEIVDKLLEDLLGDP
jgi:hypothetical protein